MNHRTLRFSQAVFSLLIALALGACTSDAQKIEEHVAAADAYIEQADLRSALIELRSALALDPKSAELNERIAAVYSGLNRPARSAFYYGEAYRLDPSRIDAALAQAPAFYSSDPDAAEALVTEVLEKAPDSSLAHVRYAEVLLLRSDTQGALAEALTAVELDPDSVIARRVVAAVQRSMIRESHLLGKPADTRTYQEAIEASQAAAAAAERTGAQPGPWYDRMQEALSYSDWPGHAEEAKAAMKEAFAMADAADDRAGRLTVTREARRLAAGLREPEFNRWAVERWVEVEPNAIRGWALLASMAQREGRSGDEVWERALSARPEDMALHAGFVRALADADRIADARAHLKALPPAIADGDDAWALRAELAIRENDLDEAKGILKELRAKHPDSPLTGLTAARIAVPDGRVAEALELLRALSGRVERPDVLRDLAKVEAMAGNGDAALAAAERAIELAPGQSPGPYAVKMRMLAAKGDWAGTLRTWREMRSLALPMGAPLHRLRIQALYETGREAVARRLLDEVLNGENPPLVMVLLFYQYEGTSQPERTHALLVDAARRFPLDLRIAEALALTELRAGRGEAALARLDEYDARTGVNGLPGLRAQILWALGRRDEAEAAARVAFAMKPRPDRAATLLVEILQGQGKADEAIQILEQSDDLGSWATWQLGRLYLDRGDLAKAREHLEVAAREPRLISARNDLAYTLALQGEDLDRAVELARAVKSAMPDTPAVADTLGFVYLQKGLLEPAAFEFRSAIELARVAGREEADFHYHLGLALQGMGRNEEARSAFDDALRIEPEHEKAQQARARVEVSSG